jgi:hypothetical protein
MIGRLVRTALWLLVGAAAVFGLYWLLLNTPESNVPALIASALLGVSIVVVAAVVVNAALGLAGGARFGASLRAAVKNLHWVIGAVMPAGLLWWAILRADRWLLDHSGEINAWFIARFGWADISWLFRAELWVSRWLRWSLVPLIALTLARALIDGGLRELAGRWRRVLGWRSVAIGAVAFVVLMALPLPLVGWRPRLPPSWLEPTAAAARLAVVALLWATGAALLVLLAVAPQSSVDGARPDD